MDILSKKNNSGVGLLAESTIFLLTLLWGTRVIIGNQEFSSERCFFPCSDFPELKMWFVAFLESKGGREFANFALEKTTRVFLKTVSTLHIFNARLRKKIGDVEKARALFHFCKTEPVGVLDSADSQGEQVQKDLYQNQNYVQIAVTTSLHERLHMLLHMCPKKSLTELCSRGKRVLFIDKFVADVNQLRIAIMDKDIIVLQPSGFYSTESGWGFSITGHFLVDNNRDGYIVANSSTLSMNNLNATQIYLAGLSRLGFAHIAARLLFNYCHTRITLGIRSLQSSTSFLHGIYVHIAVTSSVQAWFNMLIIVAFLFTTFILYFGNYQPRQALKKRTTTSLITKLQDLSPYIDNNGISELRSIPFKGGGDDTDMDHDAMHYKLEATQCSWFRYLVRGLWPGCAAVRCGCGAVPVFKSLGRGLWSDCAAVMAGCDAVVGLAG